MGTIIYVSSAICALGVGASILTSLHQKHTIEASDRQFKGENHIPFSVPLAVASHGRVYRTLKLVHEILSENGIHYVLIAGSALGYERHRGIIPWDDDVDLGVSLSDRATTIKLLSDNKISTEAKWWGGITVQNCVDIFFMEYNTKMSRYQYCTSKARAMWPREYFTKDEFEDRREVRDFGELGAVTFISSRNLDYLHRAFGRCCLSECRVKPLHSFSAREKFIYDLNPFVVKRFHL